MENLLYHNGVIGFTLHYTLDSSAHSRGPPSNQARAKQAAVCANNGDKTFKHFLASRAAAHQNSSVNDIIRDQ
jgi:hypothetical protein